MENVVYICLMLVNLPLAVLANPHRGLPL